MNVRPTGARYCDCGKCIRGDQAHCARCRGYRRNRGYKGAVKMPWAEQRRDIQATKDRLTQIEFRGILIRTRHAERHESDPDVLRFREAVSDPHRIARLAKQREDCRLAAERAERQSWNAVKGWGNRFRVDRSEVSDWWNPRRPAA